MVIGLRLLLSQTFSLGKIFGLLWKLLFFLPLVLRDFPLPFKTFPVEYFAVNDPLFISSSSSAAASSILSNISSVRVLVCVVLEGGGGGFDLV